MASWVWMALIVNLVFLGCKGEGLSNSFYKKTCPNLVQIVATIVNRHLKQDPSMGAPIVRMFFHDCFVRASILNGSNYILSLTDSLVFHGPDTMGRNQGNLYPETSSIFSGDSAQGCDASVMLISPNKTAERDAVPNLTLSQFDVIDEIKSNVEKECPGTVSCADILALAARDAVLQSGGPSWAVELGRRDGLVSKDFDAATHLPSSLSNAQALIDSFTSNGLSIRDLVALSGAHTFGKTHCQAVARRLYTFGGTTGSNGVDPTLNKTYAMKLKSQCPQPVNPNAKVPLDPVTPDTFDNAYYTDLLQDEGIFSSDSALVQDPRTKAVVLKYAQDENIFRQDFAWAMIRMGRLGYRSGQQTQEGEIRNKCSATNSAP